MAGADAIVWDSVCIVLTRAGLADEHDVDLVRIEDADGLGLLPERVGRVERSQAAGLGEGDRHQRPVSAAPMARTAAATPARWACSSTEAVRPP